MPQKKLNPGSGRRNPPLPKNVKGGAPGEQGIVIVLVAVVMLFVIGAMAALSIDVVTLYTARSEAQLAAEAVDEGVGTSNATRRAPLGNAPALSICAQ